MRTFFIAVSALIGTAYTSNGQIIIHYENDKNESIQVNEKLKKQLTDSIRILKPERVEIHGYTDSVGTISYN